MDSHGQLDFDCPSIVEVNCFTWVDHQKKWLDPLNSSPLYPSHISGYVFDPDQNQGFRPAPAPVLEGTIPICYRFVPDEDRYLYGVEEWLRYEHVDPDEDEEALEE